MQSPSTGVIGSVQVLATLESIDRPQPSSANTYNSPRTQKDGKTSLFSVDQNGPDQNYRPEVPRRVSCLPPLPTVRSGFRSGEAGPSTVQRYFFVAVRRGHSSGVYNCWAEAEKQIQHHPCPVFKTFSTRLAAEAFVAGWEGSGRHSLPASSPRPLREHLAMTFPSSVPLPSSNRPSYHSRILSSTLPPAADAATLRTDFGPRPSLTARPHSYRHSLVKISSPLRQQVDEPSIPPVLRKTTSFAGIGGLLSPPSSPNQEARGPKPPPAQMSLDDRKAFRPRSVLESYGSGSNRPHPSRLAGVITPPPSPPLSPERRRPQVKKTPSGLWADAKPSTPSALSSAVSPDLDFSASLSAPKFSRAGLRKTGVIMPVSAPRSSSSSSLPSSLKGKSSRSSLNSPSMTSLNSASSYDSRAPRRQSASTNASQDRLSSLAETSQRELQLNEEGLLALDSLSPPRAAFMRSRSNSSLSSLSSLTSAASATASSIDSCDPIQEEPMEVEVVGHDDVTISCTKSDADGSIESSSVKSGATGHKVKKGGLFKRLTKAIGLEKKSVPGDSGRRGSL